MCSILNDGKYFSSDGLQIYLVFAPINKYPFSVAPIKSTHGHLQECQKKVLKVLLHPTIALLQKVLGIQYQK